MAVLSNIYDTVRTYRNAKGEQIHRLTDGQRRILKRLIDDQML